MATTLAANRPIEIAFDSYLITNASLDLGQSPKIQPGTTSKAYISCHDKEEMVGVNFYDRQPPPNSYRIARPNNILVINFHFSRFNDIINILRYHKPLILTFDSEYN